MNYHLDRTVRFAAEGEFKNLYSWCLEERGEDGEKVGRDWIPWAWTLYFRAKNVSLRESESISPRWPEDAEKGKNETTSRRIIKAALYPEEGHSYPPRYSMLGTDRTMTEFELNIEVIADDKEEHCRTYGRVSHTTDIDFRDVTDDDRLWFIFYVHAAKFEHYARRIAAGEVDAVTVHVGRVTGFYSDWSPGISTDKIRILTDLKKEQAVQGIPDGFTLPRLGEVGEAALFFAREINLPLPEPEPDEPEDIEPDQRPVDRIALREAERDKRSAETVKLLTSLRIAAWLIALVLFVLLFRR